MHALMGHAIVFVAGLGVGALGMAQTGERDAPPEASDGGGAAPRASALSPFTVAQAPDRFPPTAEATDATVREIWGQLQTEQAAREQLAADVARLQDELNALRRDVVASAATTSHSSLAADDLTDAAGNIAPPLSSDPAEAMVALGVSPQVAADIKRRVDQADLARLTLRDQASREGWLGTERYFEELGKVEGDVQALRTELGDETYDKFLYSIGQVNRVTVAGVLDGSAAATAGIRESDTVFAYAGKRIFSWDELRAATTEGAAGEYIPVTIMRDGAPVEFLMPRGPLGIKLDATRQHP